MDGKRVQDYWSREVDALLDTYKQFETLIPAKKGSGAAHRGEDGRYVEDLLREYLAKFLPRGIEVLTGFILRPAVKTGNGKERAKDIDEHSSQLDIIIFDSEQYPVYQRFGNSVVVPPEGVIAIISVKKHLNDIDIKNECEALLAASRLCRSLRTNKIKEKIRGPFTSLVSMRSNIQKANSETEKWIFSKMEEVYNLEQPPKYDHIIDYIGSFSDWSIKKGKPQKNTQNKVVNAKFFYTKHEENDFHLSLQFILNGILSVFYDETRRNICRPGYTGFSQRDDYTELGTIKCGGER